MYESIDRWLNRSLVISRFESNHQRLLGPQYHNRRRRYVVIGLRARQIELTQHVRAKHAYLQRGKLLSCKYWKLLAIFVAKNR